ncbi:MAG: helix-turn-helix transcriptional regulator [Lentisphaerae bacterium]|nr:helix-turn-helix transcriptional regulator [Lentisphaerota bacterium]MCP4100355.1 helix-turn-helix transcriptional regulator [Lentisphaerota bacterium]
MGNLNKQLKEYISKHGITQKKVADDLGVSQTAVYRWVKGDRGIALRHKQSVAKYIEIPPEVKMDTTMISIEGWPFTKEMLLKVISHYSKSKNRVKLFKLLADIEKEAQDNENHWDLMG